MSDSHAKRYLSRIVKYEVSGMSPSAESFVRKTVSTSVSITFTRSTLSSRGRQNWISERVDIMN